MIKESLNILQHHMAEQSIQNVHDHYQTFYLDSVLDMVVHELKELNGYEHYDYANKEKMIDNTESFLKSYSSIIG